MVNPQKVIERADRRRRRSVSLVVVANLCVAMLITVLVFMVLRASYKAQAQQAVHVAESLANIAAANVHSELSRVDAVIRSTASEIERLSDEAVADDATIKEILQARLQLLNGVESLRLSDSKGKVLWGLRPGEVQTLDVSDRDYFLKARHEGHDSTIVTGPIVSRVTGKWVLIFARPVMGGGRFEGVLYAAIGVTHFNDLFDQYVLGEQDSVALRTVDHRLVARRSPGLPPLGEPGSAVVSETSRGALQAMPERGAFVATGALDEVERTYAYRVVKDWPLVMYGGISNQRYFNSWRQHAFSVCALAAMVWLFASLAALVIYRGNRRESESMRTLAAQTVRTQGLLRVAGDGIHILNQHGRVIDMSDSFAEMLGSTREKLLGRHISTWDPHVRQMEGKGHFERLKPGDRMQAQVVHQRDDGRFIDVDLSLSVTEMDGERVIFASGRDVTERNQLVREQAAMLESDLVGMFRVEGRSIVWRNAALEAMLGYAPGELAGQALSQLYPSQKEFREFAAEAYPVLREGQRFRKQVRTRKRNGEPIWVDLSGIKLTDTQTFWMGVDVTAMREAHDAMAHVAFHDALTGLPNRLLLADRLKRTAASARRDGSQVAVCFVDLDGFKAINDEHGHDAGDEMLVCIARRLQEGIRPSDTAARLGGDEFVLLLSVQEDSQWRVALDRLVHLLSEPITLRAGVQVQVGVTIGVALSSSTVTELDTLIERADRAMLQGKKQGKGRLWVAPAVEQEP